MFKRLLAFQLVLAFIISFIPISAVAASEEPLPPAYAQTWETATVDTVSDTAPLTYFGLLEDGILQNWFAYTTTNATLVDISLTCDDPAISIERYDANNVLLSGDMTLLPIEAAATQYVKVYGTPATTTSFMITIEDVGNYDNDDDGLTNYQEIGVYHTDPDNPDMDGDELCDGDEIALGLSPINSKTNGTTLDAERVFEQIVATTSYDEAVFQNNVATPSLYIKSKGNPSNQVYIYETIKSLGYQSTAIIGKSISIEFSESFLSGKITFSLSTAKPINQVIICKYNQNTFEFTPLETKAGTGNTIVADLTGSGDYFVLGIQDFLTTQNIDLDKYTVQLDENGDTVYEPLVGQEYKTPTTFDKLADGKNHTLLLRSDGTVWAWGCNLTGECGVTGTSYANMGQVPGISNIKNVAAGADFSLALTASGTVMSWGINTYGQLGSGNTTSRTAPGAVNGMSNVIAIAAGENHTLMLKNDGTVWACGYNNYGQLGDNTITNKSTPIQVPGLTGVVAISAGYQSSMALKSDGSVWTWGYNTYGQIGNGTTTTAKVPVKVNIPESISKIEAGTYHCLAVSNTGIWAWGYNVHGELGNGATTNLKTPTKTISITGVESISATQANMLLDSSGDIWMWGYNSSGQLGDGTTTNRLTPYKLSNPNNILSICETYVGSLAIRMDNSLFGWGSNSHGQLGQPKSTTLAKSPLNITSIPVTQGAMLLSGNLQEIKATQPQVNGTNEVFRHLAAGPSNGVQLIIAIHATKNIQSRKRQIVDQICKLIDKLQANGVTVWYGISIISSGNENNYYTAWSGNYYQAKDIVNSLNLSSTGTANRLNDAFWSLGNESNWLGEKNKHVVVISDKDYQKDRTFINDDGLDWIESKNIALTAVVANPKLYSEGYYVQRTGGTAVDFRTSWVDTVYNVIVNPIVKTNKPTVIKLKNGAQVTLNRYPNLYDTVTDTDHDGLSDGAELGRATVADYTKIAEQFKGTIYPTNKKVYIPVFNFKSNPNSLDTDNDGYGDKADLQPRIPYKIPVLFVPKTNLKEFGLSVKNGSLVVGTGSGNNVYSGAAYRLKRLGYVPNHTLFGYNYTSKTVADLHSFIESNLRNNTKCYPTSTSYMSKNLKLVLFANGSEAGARQAHGYHDQYGANTVEKVFVFDSARSTPQIIANIDKDKTLSSMENQYYLFSKYQTAWSKSNQIDGFFGGVAYNFKASEIALTTSGTALSVGQAKQLPITVYPSFAANKQVTWKSSNPSIISVDTLGTVNALAKGSATITCTAANGSGKTSVKLTATPAIVAVKGISLSLSETTLYINQAIKLIPTISPSNATNMSVRWQSSDTAIAHVMSDGLVKALAEGTVVISCYTPDGNFSAQCVFHVEKGDAVASATFTKANIADADKLLYTVKLANGNFYTRHVTQYSDGTDDDFLYYVTQEAKDALHGNIPLNVTESIAVQSGKLTADDLIRDGTYNITQGSDEYYGLWLYYAYVSANTQHALDFLAMATVGSIFTVKLIAMEARAASLAKGQRQTLSASELDDLVRANEGAASAEYNAAKAAGWKKPDGSTWWPSNNGAVVGTEQNVTLQAGERIGRIGNNQGVYVAPPGTSPGQLSLKPGTDVSVYHEYTIVKPIQNVQKATVAPWFDEAGGGIQFKLPQNIQYLLDNGFIR